MRLTTDAGKVQYGLRVKLPRPPTLREQNVVQVHLAWTDHPLRHNPIGTIATINPIRRVSNKNGLCKEQDLMSVRGVKDETTDCRISIRVVRSDVTPEKYNMK
jgi:hypothetical protein